MWKILKEDHREYYLIRVEIVWSIMGLFIACMAFLFFLQCSRGESVKREVRQADYKHKIQEPVESGLGDTAGCYLCGTNKRSLMGHYRGIDDLGIRNSKDKAERDRRQNGSSTSRFGTGEGGDFFQVSQDFSRGLVEVTIDYGEDSIFDADSVKDNLCQKCLDKLLGVMDSYCSLSEAEQARDLCLIDFQTMELYALQEYNRSYYIRDYYVWINMDDNEAEVRAFYMPALEAE